MVPSDKLTVRVMRKLSVFRSINRCDFVVIFILWSSNLFEPWLADWDDVSLPNLFNDVSVLTSTAFKLNLGLVFIFKCALCITMSLFTDLHDHKYFAYVVCLCVYFITPLLGLLIYSTQMVHSLAIIPWGLSFMFICRPVQLCTIFSQSPSIPGKWSRLMSSLFVLSACISIYIASTSFEDTFDGIRHHMILVTWAVVLVAFVILIPITVYLKKYVRREVVTEDSLKLVLIQIREDLKTDGAICRVPKNALKIILFISLLIPILLSNVVHAHILQIDGSDQGKNLDPLTINEVVFWQVVAIPLVEITLLVVNILNKMTAGILSLGLPHLINMSAVTLIFIDFNSIASKLEGIEFRSLIDERDTMLETVGPVTAPKTEVFEFYNLLDRTVNVSSEYFEFQVEASGRSACRIVNRVYAFNVKLTVDSPQKYRPIIFEVHGNVDEISSYVIKNKADASGRDIRLLEVTGHQWVRPVKCPVLVFMDTFVNINVSTHWIEVKDAKSNFSVTFPAPEPTKSVHLYPPSSSLKISYTTGQFAERRFLLASEELDTQPYSVYTLLVDKDDRNVFDVHSFLIMQLKVSDDDELDELDGEDVLEKHQTRPMILAAFGLHGASLGVMQVGYIHHFWTEAPIRLRTTLLAAFQVLEAFIDLLLYSHFGEFSKQESYTILFVQIFCTIWHFVLGGFYYFYFGSRKPDRFDPPTSNVDIKAHVTTSDIRADSKLDSVRRYLGMSRSLSRFSDPALFRRAETNPSSDKEIIVQPKTLDGPKHQSLLSRLRTSRTADPADPSATIVPQEKQSYSDEPKNTKSDTTPGPSGL